MSLPTVMCYAHRGASAYLKENTLPAFRLAHTLGADGFECDVRLCADGELVVIHDSTVDRTTDGAGRVARLSLEEIRQLNAGSRKRPTPIPTVEETLALAHELRMQVNLEVKGDRVEDAIGVATALVPALEALKPADRSRVLISSFEHDALGVLRDELSWLRLAALYDSVTWGSRDIVAHAQALGVHAIHPADRMITPKLLRNAEEAGLAVNVWTVNRRAVIRRMIQLGVSGLISDRPERVVIERSRHALVVEEE